MDAFSPHFEPKNTLLAQKLLNVSQQHLWLNDIMSLMQNLWPSSQGQFSIILPSISSPKMDAFSPHFKSKYTWRARKDLLNVSQQHLSFNYIMSLKHPSPKTSNPAHKAGCLSFSKRLLASLAIILPLLSFYIMIPWGLGNWCQWNIVVTLFCWPQ
jgi:hypothetical protein